MKLTIKKYKDAYYTNKYKDFFYKICERCKCMRSEHQSSDGFSLWADEGTGSDALCGTGKCFMCTNCESFCDDELGELVERLRKKENK